MNDIIQYAASNRNPPKGYDSIEIGMKVAAYRGERLDHWKHELQMVSYTIQVCINAEQDVVEKFGKPF